MALNPPARPSRPAGAVASCAVTIALWAVVALLAAAPAQAQTVTIEKIPGEDSFDSAERAQSTFRIRARGSDAPWRGTNVHAGITVGVEFDYQGRDVEYWENSNYTKAPGNKVSRFEVVLSRTPGHEAAGSVTGNRFWDLTEHDMGNHDLHLIGPVIVRLYDPPGGRTYSLGSDREICLVINESDGTAGEPCSSSQRRGVLPDRLTASFDGLPASHDGETAFSFRIQFSEDIDATVDGMRDHALNVTGGTVTGAARVKKRDDLWSFTITPLGDAKVDIILAGGASCTADGAICTSDGRQLSTGLLTFVSGPLPTLSIGDVEAYEGVDEYMTFMVSMDRAVTERSWFDYATADGTAEAGSDYTAKSGELWYLGPEDTGNEGEFKNWLIEVPIIDDDVEDDGETFTVTLSGAKGVTIGNGVATGTIRNSEDPVEISIADAEATEDGDGWIRFRLSLNHVAKDVTVDYATADGTATAGVDYTATSGSVVLRRGTINTHIAVPVLNDAVEDDGETFTLTLSNVSGADIADGEATGTIRDGEAEPVSTVSTGPLWSADMSVTDFGNGSIGAWGTDKFSNVGGSANLEAKWLWYSTGDRKLNLAFTTAPPNTTGLSLYMGDVAVAFPDGGGDSSFSWTDVDVAWTDGETIPVRIGQGAVALPPANMAPTGLPAISGTARVGETLTASIDEIADADGLDNATFAYQWLSNDGTSDTDIEGAADSTYTLAAADAGKTVRVQVTFTDDGGTEETLVSQATDAVNTAPTGLPAISGTARVGETLTASIDEIADADGLDNATFAYQWLSNDGTSDTDIEGATDSTYTLAAADAGKTVRVQVTFTDDGGTEETLVSQATDAVNTAPTGLPTISGTARVGETLTASIDEIADADGLDNATFAYQWLSNDGTSDTDIEGATDSTYTLAAADAGKTVRVQVTFTDDGGTEEAVVSIATEAVADPPSGLSVADAEGTEEEDAALDFVVTLDPAATAAVTVDYATADGTATAGSDYTATSGTLTFQPGDTEKTVSVPITDDAVEDSGETFKLLLINANGADLADAEATGTIRNDDDVSTLKVVRFAVADAEATEANDATLDFVVTLNQPVAERVTVDFKTSDGTATAGTDYTVTSGTLAFEAGRYADREQTIAVPIIDDTVEDDGETLTLTLTNATGFDFLVADAVATGTIRNTEAAADPSELSVANAEATEEEDAALDFVVTLDPAATAAVTVDYATADGTATAGSDYTATSGTLTFQPGDTEKTVSVPITDDAVDDGGETLTLTLSSASGADLDDAEATGTIQNTETLLTASFENMPSEHDGSTVFTFRLRFSEDPAVSYTVLRDRAFTVSGGTVEKARRVDGRNDLREIHVQPKTTGEIRIDLPATTDCDASGAICTADDRPLSHSLSATVSDPVGISVADARVDENGGAPLAFTVTLSRAADGALTVDYATADGSAQAGMDYTAASGTLTFQAGESSQTIEVTVLDDSHDDSEETLTLTLSNASSGRLTDAEATGTIANTDALPRALLARFGRATALQVMEQVEERLEASRDPGLRGRFAGRELRRGMEREMGRNFLSRLESTAVAGARDTTGVQSDLSGADLLRMGLGGGDVLTGSGFVLNREAGEGGSVSLWSRGMESRFNGRDGELSLDGGVRTTMFGADYAKGPLMAGLMLSHRRGLGGYQGANVGKVASSVTGLHPWVGYKLTDRVTLWGVTGYGRGSLSLTPGEALSLPTSATSPISLKGGLSMSMLAGGMRGDLVDPGVGGFGLAFKADALWVGTGNEAVDGPAGRLAGVEAVVTRVRTALEASRGYVFGRGIALRPSLELGLRRDGGDAEIGAGADVAGSLIASDPLTGLSVDVHVRTLLAHQAEGFRERGVSVSFSYDPTPSTPLGFKARVAPSWGEQTTNGADALWGRDTMTGLGAAGPGSGDRLDAELGYALPVGNRLVGTPRFGVTTSEYGRDYRLGYSLSVVQGSAMTFEFGLDAQRRQSLLGQGNPDHSLHGRVTARW